jgi:hypothetical protein
MMERDPELQWLIDESKIRNLLDKYPRASIVRITNCSRLCITLARSMTTASIMGLQPDTSMS